VFDVSGAGDTVIATMALAHASGRTLAQSAPIANAAAGVVVSKAGTATAHIAEVMHELGADEQGAWEPPSLSAVADVASLVDHWKALGLTVGFTNGCFDILHRGHIAYLAQARAWCDRLVVGLNTDAGVRRLKGEGRPVNDLESRALVLGGLASVDLVVPFDEETPLALIEAARPDVLVKGADYSLDGVVGRDLVESYGGVVRLADLVEGHSTSATLKKLSRRA
jgi:D-beta-D-heptose 7-phosphate kinase/D-beta-D-heptose 1-phosphate adenosyltransferase